MKSELGGYDHVGAKRSESFAHEFFICEWAIGFSGIEEGDAAFHGHAENSDHLLLVLRRTKPEAHPHAAEAQRRNFEVASSKRSLFHHAVRHHICSVGLIPSVALSRLSVFFAQSCRSPMLLCSRRPSDAILHEGR